MARRIKRGSRYDADNVLNKFSVAVATTANITLSGEQTIDGAVTNQSRVLVKNQSVASKNGIYVSAIGAWARASDMDTWSEVYDAGIFVGGGTTQGATGWASTVASIGTLDSTAITFVQQSATISYSASGVGLILTGSTFALAGQALALHLVAGSGVFTRSAGGDVALTATGVAAAGAILTRGDGDSRYQPLSTTLNALANTNLTNDLLIYGNGTGSAGTTPFTSLGRSIAGAVDAPTARFLIGADIASNIAYSPDVALGQTTDVDNKLNQHRTLFDTIPADKHASIINGTNTADLTVYVQRALNMGGVIDTLGYTYLTLGLTISVPGTRIVGSGRFLLVPEAASGTIHLQIATSNVTIEKDVVFDGGGITTPSVWVYGIRNSAQVSNLKLLCQVKRYSFIGVEIHDYNGAWKDNKAMWLGVTVSDVGWAGIVVHGVRDVDLTHSRVIGCGYHGYDIQGCSHVHGSLRVDRSVKSYRVYDGPGYTPVAFCVSRFNNTDEVYTDCDLIGNGSGDIWGLGEGGGDASNCQRTVVSGVFTDRIKGTGFDVTSNMTADIVLCGPNCFLGLDYGGLIENVTLRAVIDGPVDDAACRLPPTIVVARTVNTVAGSPVVTVVGDPLGTGGYLLPGTIVTGPNIPSGATVLTVRGSELMLSLNVAVSQAGVSVVFRGKLVWRNIDLTLIVSNAKYALALWDAIDSAYGSFSNVNIRIVAREIKLSEVIAYPLSKLPPGVRVEVISGDGEPKTVSFASGGFSALGRRSFILSGSGALNRITDGYPGQEISCYASSDMTLHFDWADLSGYGEDRLLGKDNAAIVLKGGGEFRAMKRYQGGWYVSSVVNPYPSV